MSRRSHYVVTFLALCFWPVAIEAQTAASAPLAGSVISDWTGGVEVQFPGKPSSKPSRGEMLPEGSVISTNDGRMLLTIRSDESKILIRPRTRIILHQPSSTSWNTLEVLLGRIRAYIQKRTGGSPPFQLGTPSAVIAVRGTRFDVEVNGRGTTEVDVFDGLVEVAGAGIQGQSVLVGPGFSTRVAVGGAPETPVPTREIRPDVDSPEARVQDEFSRDARMQADRPAEGLQSAGPRGELDDAHQTGAEREAGDH